MYMRNIQIIRTKPLLIRLCTSAVVIGLLLQSFAYTVFAQQEGISFRINDPNTVTASFPIISAVVSVPCNLISRITENYQVLQEANVVYDRNASINKLTSMIDLYNQTKPTRTAILLDLWAGTQQQTQEIQKALDLGLQVEQKHQPLGRNDTFLLLAPDQSGRELNLLYEGDDVARIVDGLNHYEAPNVQITPLVDFLVKAIDRIGDTSRINDSQQTIIVFSNGFDLPDDEKLAMLLKRANDANIQINTVFFDSGFSERIRLEQIAVATSGRAYYLNKTPLLSDLWRGLFAVETRCDFSYRTNDKNANSLRVERIQLSAQAPLSATISFGPVQLDPPKVQMVISTDPLSSTLTYSVSWGFEKLQARQVVTVGAWLQITETPYSTIFLVGQGDVLSNSKAISQVVDLGGVQARPINGSAYVIDEFGKRGEAVGINTYFAPLPTPTATISPTLTPEPSATPSAWYQPVTDKLDAPFNWYSYLASLLIAVLLFLVGRRWFTHSQKGIKLVPSSVSPSPIHALLYRESRLRNTAQIIAIRPDDLTLGSEKTSDDQWHKRHYFKLAPGDIGNRSVLISKDNNTYELRQARDVEVDGMNVGQTVAGWKYTLRQGARLVLGNARFIFIPLRAITPKSEQDGD